MNLCSIFQLNVLRVGSDCQFFLTWEDRQQLSARLKYPEELDRLCQEWRVSYFRAYPPPVRGRAEESFGFTPASIDWKNRAEEAEKALLQRFQKWLGGPELLEIRQQIQSAAARNILHRKQRSRKNSCVDLLIACDSPALEQLPLKQLSLEQLPWETWKIAPKEPLLSNIHISRTIFTTGDNVVPVEAILRRGKVRILAILADASELELLEDERALRSLGTVAQVQTLKFQVGHDVARFRQQFVRQLEDDRGWDALIFAGHSEETDFTGGRLHLAPGVALSLSEIEQPLIEAKNRGLRFALFNSCNGLNIAKYLLELGLHQVLVMREKIHDRAAPVFLKKWCDCVAAHQNVRDALLETFNYLKTEKYAYPCAYLVPSLFRHPSSKAKLFQIEPLGWRRLARDWKPSRGEAIALGAILLASSIVPLQDFLLDIRMTTQAVYREIAGQVPQKNTPPVQLIAIDQESINQAQEEFPNFRTYPIDRRYLAQLIDRLSELKVKTIGINYELYSQEAQSEKLRASIRSAIEEQNTWLILANNNRWKRKVLPQFASPNWSLQGDERFLAWDVKLPQDETCAKPCPFAYLLAISYFLNNDSSLSNLPQPNLTNSTNFQQELSEYIHQNNVITSLKKAYPPLGWRSLIDFSIPPQHVYDIIPAWKFLESDSSIFERQQQVAIIASGGYEEAEDNFSVPLAVSYWCRIQNWRNKLTQKCPQVFTGGEAHAYMVYHLTSERRVTLIPDFLLILTAAALGKWATLILLEYKFQQRRKLVLLLAVLPMACGLLFFQAYISFSLTIPWFFPAVIFWIYLSLLMRK